MKKKTRLRKAKKQEIGEKQKAAHYQRQRTRDDHDGLGQLFEPREGEAAPPTYDPDFERKMKLAEEIMDDDRDVLKALSK
jgi:hypothetical protein